MSARQDVTDLGAEYAERTCAGVAEEAESELSFLRKRHVLKTCANRKRAGLSPAPAAMYSGRGDGAWTIEAEFLGDRA